MLLTPGKPVNIYNGAGIIGISVSKTFTKQNIGKREASCDRNLAPK
jgi:hypothetical protein